MNIDVIVRQSQQALRYVINLLFPPHCAVCRRSGYELCPSCLANIRPLSPPFCAHCNTPLTATGVCRYCHQRPLQINGIYAASRYEEPLRTCILALKYEGKTQLCKPLGALLAQTYQARALPVDMLIAVPLHRERQQQRGYNQSQLLAEVCAAQIKVPAIKTGLTRVRATEEQAQLPASERQQNVAGAFLCPEKQTSGEFIGRSILIIDDVCTTGATLEACATALFTAGAKAVWGLVLARSV